jgi:hypothetical protein
MPPLLPSFLLEYVEKSVIPCLPVFLPGFENDIEKPHEITNVQVFLSPVQALVLFLLLYPITA